MTRRAIDRMRAPGRRPLPGVAVLAASVFLAYASSVGAQPAAGAAAERASASPQVSPPEQLPGPGSSVAEVPGLLRFQFTPKFLTGVPIPRSSAELIPAPRHRRSSIPR